MIVLIAIGQVARDRAGRVGDDGLDAADVVGEPALDLARSRLGEEAQRHALEVGVERAAQVLHDALADDVVEVALADADEARDDRQHDHQADVQVQLLVVAADDDLVDQQAQQQRVDQADEARRQDRRQDDDDLEPVRLEEGDDPPQRAAAALLGDRLEVRGRAPNAPATADRRPRPAAPPVAVRVCPRGNPIRRPPDRSSSRLDAITERPESRSAGLLRRPAPVAMPLETIKHRRACRDRAAMPVEPHQRDSADARAPLMPVETIRKREVSGR